MTQFRTRRLTLEVLDLERIDALLEAPDGWPAEDVAHLARWRGLAVADGGYSDWRAWSVTDATGATVGHVGFHGPPQPITNALSDPTFVGIVEPSAGGAVEVGYAIFEPFRRRGFVVEAVSALLAWAHTTGEVSTVIACVRKRNDASLAVLDRLGGFTQIGTCRDGDVDEDVFRRDLVGPPSGSGQT